MPNIERRAGDLSALSGIVAKLNPYKRDELRKAYAQGAFHSLADVTDPPAYMSRTERIAWGRGHGAMRDSRVLGELREKDCAVIERRRVQRGRQRPISEVTSP